MIMNEKIRVAEVELTGIDGERLGIVSTREALALAKQLKADLVCVSLMQSPPPCRLVARGKARDEIGQERKRERQPKQKELRLTAQIEEHDYDTKLQQAERILRAGDHVLLVVKIAGKEGERARKLLERLVADLRSLGKPQTGLQLSGKQAMVVVVPAEG